MNKVLEHAVADYERSLWMRGSRSRYLQRQLAWHNQWLPVDPPAVALKARRSGQRTIGGLIASNSLGAAPGMGGGVLGGGETGGC